MVTLIAIVSTLLVASTSQAARIPNAHRALSHRDNVPEGWVTPIMEPYDAYHTRYMALHCEDKHDTAFFDDCCHPMKINETLADARKPECNPANAVSTAASTSAAAASTNVSTGDDGDDDDEDCDDDGEDGADDDDGEDDATTIVSVPVATPTPTPSKMKTSKISKPTTAPTTSTASETSAAATTEAAKPTTTPKATPTPSPSPSPKPTTSAASSSGGNSGSSSGGNVITGGKGTFFFQQGAAGSCGVYNKDSTPLVAVDIASMKPSLCGKKVLVTNTANGKSVEAIVQDTCPGCANPQSLDLSTGAFNQIADPATGVINIEYKFLD